MTTEEKLAQYGIPKDIQLIQSDYADLAAYQEKLPKGMYLFRSSPLIPDVFPQFMDYEKGKSSFQSSQFIEIAEQYKAVFHGSDLKEEYVLQSTMGSTMQAVRNLPEVMEGTPVLYAEKSKENGPYTAAVMYSLAISQNSPNGERAFSFLEWCLGKEIQKEYLAGGFVPVHTAAWKENTQENSAGLDSLREQYEKIMQNVAISPTPDLYFTQEIFYPLWTKYLSGALTAEEMAEELDHKAEIYLKEQR